MPCSVPVNCPVVICLPFMPCCLSKESTSSELWTPVQSLPLIHLPLLLVYLLQPTLAFHTIRLILCYSKPVSLTTSLIRWGKVLSLCCAGLHVACSPFEAFPSSYWFNHLGFVLRETCLLNCIIPSAWGLPTKCCCTHHASIADGSRPDTATCIPGPIRSDRSQRDRKAPTGAHQSQKGPVGPTWAHTARSHVVTCGSWLPPSHESPTLPCLQIK